LPPERVHPVDVPFTVALRVFSKWGTGVGDFVRAMHAAKSSLKFHARRKRLQNPVDSAWASVFCAAQQACVTVVGSLI
jgi:hypothetical protein